jgi:hypothetical protein
LVGGLSRELDELLLVTTIARYISRPSPRNTDDTQGDSHNNHRLRTTTVSAHPGAPTTHPTIIDWVEKVAALTTPDQLVWCDGRNEDQGKQ